MYIAELKGKLSLAAERSEDVLTSDVFSFFKYSDRDVYLRRFLERIEITDLTDRDLAEAEIIFWPTFEDGTEPDVVILVGRYYLLFEAKYLSGFAEESDSRSGQIQREIEGGLAEAKSLGKEFLAIAITADPFYPEEKLASVPQEYKVWLRWTNWQTVAQILLDVFSAAGEQSPDALFAQDLYDLLDKRRLRGFLPFSRFAGTYTDSPVENVFFSAQTANFRGAFIGFAQSLATQLPIKKSPPRLFYSKSYFRHLPRVGPATGESLFYREAQDEY